MSNQKSAEKRRGISWPVLIVISVLGMAGGLALALLLIPQLSVNAAVRGGTMGVGVFLAALLIGRASRRFRQRSGRE